MRPLLNIAALLAFLAEGPFLFAQNFEDAHAQATDVVSGTLFLYNPAVPQSHESRGSVGAVVPRSKDRDGHIFGAAYSTGGSDRSSYGVRVEVSGFSNTSDTGASGGENSFSGRYAAGHYGMQIAGVLRMGILAQLYYIDADAVRFSDGVTSKSQGLLIGGDAGSGSQELVADVRRGLNGRGGTVELSGESIGAKSVQHEGLRKKIASLW